MVDDVADHLHLTKEQREILQPSRVHTMHAINLDWAINDLLTKNCLKRTSYATYQLPNRKLPFIVPSLTLFNGKDFEVPKTSGSNYNVTGEIINFRGNTYAPTEEQGVVGIFFTAMVDLGFVCDVHRRKFPDFLGRRKTQNGLVPVRAEFEYKSRNFDHDLSKCDVIVCWVNNWKDCPIEVIELKTTIKTLDR